VDSLLQSDRQSTRCDQYQFCQSSDHGVEQEVLSNVGTYGKQIGRTGDALIMLLAHFHPERPLTSQESAAIDALKEMLNKVAEVKQKHARPALRPDPVKI
jgi:uncharacterized protein YkwD